MNRDQLINPDDFDTAEVKLQAVEESLDGLFAATQAVALRGDSIELLAALTSSLIVIHQVVAQMLKEDIGAGL